MNTITTAATAYTPPSTSVVHSAQVSLTSRPPASVVHLVQYDDTLPIVAVALMANGQAYTVPSGAAVNVRLAKPDGTYVYNPALGVSSDAQTAYIAVTLQMTVVAGKVAPVVEVVIDGDVAVTGFFVLDIDPNPIPESAIESTDEYQTIQQLAAQVEQAAQIVTENEAAIQAIGENITAIQQAPTAAANAAASATLAESWAVGGTGTREGEDTHTAKYWCNQAQTIAQGALGWYETEQALQAAHPTGQNGQWAIIGSTDTIWTWDSDTSAWVDSGAQMDLSNYYTKEQANAAFAPTSHANAETTYGAATGSLYGHVKLADTASASDASAGAAATPKCVQDAVQAVQNTLEIQPGDAVTVNRVCTPGLVTTAGTQLWMSIPLPKPVSANVSSVQITSGSIAVRGDKGYVIGSSSGDVSLSSLNISCEVDYSNVRFIISGDSAYTVTNNTPIVGYIVNTVLQFN